MQAWLRAALRASRFEDRDPRLPVLASSGSHVNLYLASMEGELLRFGRPPVFEGDEAQWQEWSFQAKAFLSLINDVVGEGLDRAQTSPIPVVFDNPPTDTQVPHVQASRRVLYCLTMLLRGPPLGIVRSAPSGNGYEAWRLLCRRYDSDQAGRQHVLLKKILRPEPFSQRPLEWEDALQNWKREVQRWESLAGEVFRPR